MYNWIVVKVCITLMALVLSGMDVYSKPDKRVTILATVGMVGDIVREIAGAEAEVRTLIGEGIDPHLYKPTRRDVLELRNADVIFYNGLLLEGRMTDSLNRLKTSGKPVFAVADLLSEDMLLLSDDKPNHHDPHIWMDVNLWSRAVDHVADSLSRLYPDWASPLGEKRKSYQQTLVQLQQYIEEIMATIPEDRKVLITAHDAFNYFGKAYGIEVMGIQGISTESEAGLNDINRLVDLLVEKNIQAIFVETSVADRNIKALIEGARSRGHTVQIGGSLFSDAMGASGTYEGTYIGMMDHNASTIARALGGRVPDDGFQTWRQANHVGSHD